MAEQGTNRRIPSSFAHIIIVLIGNRHEQVATRSESVEKQLFVALNIPIPVVRSKRVSIFHFPSVIHFNVILKIISCDEKHLFLRRITRVAVL